MRKLWLWLFLSLSLTSADAQNNFLTPPPSGVVINGVQVVTSCGNGTLITTQFAYASMDTTGKLCVSGSTSGSAATITNLPIVPPSVAPVTATTSAVVVDLRPDSPGIIALGQTITSASVPVTLATNQGSILITPLSQYSSGAIPITNSATGTISAVIATLSGTTSRTTYICGFTITADATTLATGTATVSGTISGSLTYIQTVAAVANGASNLTRTFNPCIPATGQNISITVNSAAAGLSGNTAVEAEGFQL